MMVSFDPPRPATRLPTTKAAVNAYESRATLTVRKLIKALQSLPPEMQGASIVYGVDGWRHLIQGLRVVRTLKGREIELFEERNAR